MYSSFEELRSSVKMDFLHKAQLISPPRWQGMDVSCKPDMQTYELLNHSSCVWLPDEDLEGYRKDIHPDTPWSDEHFLERICGFPLNPGIQWSKWRLATGADKSRSKDGRFNHNYMERYWPKYARKVPAATLPQPDWVEGLYPHRGILYDYGDLSDVIDLLRREPLTRQAYLPVWFPEDTGTVHGDRAPCTLGYHFIVRREQLHCVYYLRSCDVINHWRNDLYLTIRLMIWVLEQLRMSSPDPWEDIGMGSLTTHITSFHCFKATFHQLELL